MNKSKLIVRMIVFIVMVILVAGCQTNAEPAPLPEQDEAALPNEEPEPTEEPAPEPTETPVPTDIPAPTEIPMVDPYKVKFGAAPFYLVNEGGGYIHSTVFSPNSGMLAFAGTGGITIYEMKSLTKEVILEGHTEMVTAMVWSAVGNMLISASIDGTVMLWDAETYTQSAILETGPVYSLGLSPDGTKFIVGLEGGEIQIWDLESQKMITEIVSPTGAVVNTIDWASDGSLIASGEETGLIYLFDPVSGEIVQTLGADETDAASTNSVEWSPDGTLLASGHVDGKVYLWDTDTWEIIQTIDAHDGSVANVTWLPESAGLTTSGDSPSAIIWDIKTGEYISGGGSGDTIHSSAWSPNGKFLALGTVAHMDMYPDTGGNIGWLYLWVRIDK